MFRFHCAVTTSAMAALLLLIPLASAQKVVVDSEKPANLNRYTRYAWSANYLMTSLHPDDKSRVEATLKDSLSRQLQAKGYIPDEEHPDFLISYTAGGEMQGDVGIRPDMLYTRPTTFYTAPMDVWVSTLARMRVSIVDAASNAPVWQATASEKIKDRDKFMRDLNRNIDRIAANTLKKFPSVVPTK
jgi:Domain of unknown function (DUF4136)